MILIPIIDAFTNTPTHRHRSILWVPHRAIIGNFLVSITHSNMIYKLRNITSILASFTCKGKNTNPNNNKYCSKNHGLSPLTKTITGYIYTILLICPAYSVAESIPHFNCFIEASNRYQVEPELLMAIAYKESRFQADAQNIRSPKDKDIGVMQIWSNWLPKLAKYNITEKHLLKYPCVNINVGAWILADNFSRFGKNKKSLGAYNAGFHKKNEAKRQAYANDVMKKVPYYRNLISQTRRTK